MIDPSDIARMLEVYGTILPLSILLIENEEDRQFLADLYVQYENLMFTVGRDFFQTNRADLEDCVQSAVENLCKKCDTLKGLERNKKRAYIITTVRNSCLARLKEISRQEAKRDYSADAESIDQVADESDLQSVVFNKVYAMELLNSFTKLSEKDKELIRIVHLDKLGYGPVMEIYGYANEGAARTAVSRAKTKLVNLAKEKKWDDSDD